MHSGEGGNFTSSAIEIKQFCTLGGGGNGESTIVFVSQRPWGREDTWREKQEGNVSPISPLHSMASGFRPDGRTCHFLCSLLFMSASSPGNRHFSIS